MKKYTKTPYYILCMMVCVFSGRNKQTRNALWRVQKRTISGGNGIYLCSELRKSHQASHSGRNQTDTYAHQTHRDLYHSRTHKRNARGKIELCKVGVRCAKRNTSARTACTLITPSALDIMFAIRSVQERAMIVN